MKHSARHLLVVLVAATAALSGTAAGQAASPRTEDRVLTTTGYRDLRFGMSLADARATGDIRVTGRGSCSTFDLTDHAHRENRTDGYVSRAHGLVAIFARPDMVTGRGIRLGSTRAELLAAYPHATRSPFGFWLTPSTGTPRRHFEFALQHRRVSVLAVITDNQDCFD